MTKLGQGSKKKARKAAYLKRKEKRQAEADMKMRFFGALSEGNIEETARLMGVRLK